MLTSSISKKTITALTGLFLMELKPEAQEKFISEDIDKSILIGNNMLNFNSSGKDCYEFFLKK
jgi:hypothetical protein